MGNKSFFGKPSLGTIEMNASAGPVLVGAQPDESVFPTIVKTRRRNKERSETQNASVDRRRTWPAHGETFSHPAINNFRVVIDLTDFANLQPRRIGQFRLSDPPERPGRAASADRQGPHVDVKLVDQIGLKKTRH